MEETDLASSNRSCPKVGCETAVFGPRPCRQRLDARCWWRREENCSANHAAGTGHPAATGEETPRAATASRLAAWLVICLVALAGCPSGNRQPIKPVIVTVKYKGAPVPGATVTFISDDLTSPAAFGKTDAQGVAKPYTPEIGDGVVYGSHKVIINKEVIVNEKKAADQDSLEYSPGVTPLPQVKHLVPVKYNAPGTTTLTAEVTKDGPAEFVFELTD